MAERKHTSINWDEEEGEEDYYDKNTTPLFATIFCQGGRSIASLLVLTGCAFSILFGVFGWAWNTDNSKHLSFYTSDLGIFSGVCTVVCALLFIFFNFIEKYISISLVAASGCNIAALSFCVVDILYARSDSDSLMVVPFTWWICLAISVVNLTLLLALALLVFRTQRRESGGIMYVSIS